MGTRLRSLLLLLAVAFQVCNAEKSVTVVGNTECLDCAEKNVKSENAVNGLRVAINCKVSNEQYETQATAEVGSSGDFAAKLPAELLTDAGELKHECFAQLYAKSNKPCPGKNGFVPSKLVLSSKDAASGEHTFGVASGGKLSFSSATCASATFWPCPPLAWKKKFPMYKPHPHPHEYKYKPAPSHGGGYYKPPAPEYKPAPSHGGGYYKPPAPVQKPPSGGGYYKPPAPVHKPPSGGGYYNPPAYKPSPQPYHEEHHHPMYKKPMPPIHPNDHHGYPPVKDPRS